MEARTQKVPAYVIWLLHGTFQTPAVWQALAQCLAADGHQVETVDLYASAAPSMDEWARRFCRRAEAAHPGAPRLLLGYSLGGRLALHALLACPASWRGAVLVSTDTGIGDADERAARRRADAAWAERVLTEPRSLLLAAWNAQGVFQGRMPAPGAQDLAYSRDVLARPFYVYSKGRQRDLLPLLTAPSMPDTLWVTGDDDVPYAARARAAVRAVPRAAHRSVPDAAHRVPWEAPGAFLETVQEWIAGR